MNAQEAMLDFEEAYEQVQDFVEKNWDLMTEESKAHWTKLTHQLLDVMGKLVDAGPYMQLSDVAERNHHRILALIDLAIR